MHLLNSEAIRTVLIAEDDLDIQKVIRMSLKFGGVAEVFVTANGQECLSMVSRVKPDLILLDVTMPTLDGYQACRMLKANPDTQSIPVIFLTAKVQKDEVENGMNSGALGYLSKPFDPLTLYKQIVDILAKNTTLGKP